MSRLYREKKLIVPPISLWAMPLWNSVLLETIPI